MSLTYGELFAGYGGLGMGVQSVLGGEMAWCAEFDAAPSRILAHHWPDVPNLGDVTKIDWATVPRVDVITGGSPCQDLSHAGKRAGMTTGTRSNLWVEMREAIATIRPRLVVWENVRGAGSAEADSALEQCSRCVGDPRDRGAVLRALGRVLGDFSELGYDAWWTGFPASDVGACHGRFRYFIFATPADTEHGTWGEGAGLGSGPREASAVGAAGGVGGHSLLRANPTTVELFPTPRATDGTKGGPNQRGSSGDLMLPSAVQRLLPTPAAHDSGNSPEDHLRKKPGRTTITSLQVLANGGLLPTPSVADVTGGRKSRSGDRNNELLLNGIAATQDWREYEAAVRRQERASGQPAPLPTEPGPKGGARLSPRFVEWMMWLPEGHVTDPVIWEGMTDAKGRVLQGERLKSAARNAELKALGNGVIPAQSAAATRWFLNQLAMTKAVA